LPARQRSLKSLAVFYRFATATELGAWLSELNVKLRGAALLRRPA